MVSSIMLIILQLEGVKSCCTYNMCLCTLSGCLKLLPPEELEHLDVPVGEESTSPVNKVLYISENDTPSLVGNTALSQHRTEATRFNLFTGNQTLDQRDKSFKVRSFILIDLMASRIDARSHV